MLRAPVVPPMRKRPKPAEAGGGPGPGGDVRFPDVGLYLVERKMGQSRRSFLTRLATSKGFRVLHVLSDEVTHIVSEDNQGSGLWAWLRGCGLKLLPKMHVLDISWFTDSMREGRPVAVEAKHRLQDALPESSPAPPMAAVSPYACQRRTTTENHNKIFTEAFEVLAESCEFSEREGPCLAFRRAASVLKSLPWAVQCLGAARSLPCLGEQTKVIMEEILQHGHSFDVEKVLSDERYQTLKLFTSVFGVGPKTGDKWYRRGLRSLRDILEEPSIQLNRMQKVGFLHYGDISRAVSRAEALALGGIIDGAVGRITRDAVLVLTGGFRRGKEFGHDVDFLLTTPQQGKEEALLLAVLDTLRQQGILLYCDYHPSTFDISKLRIGWYDAMDHYPKGFLIMRLEGSQVEGGLQRDKGDDRGWRAVRVDLVSPPMDRYAFALLGWTGSRQFDRDLRRYARRERRMLVDNHALYDKTKKEFLAAETEKDIFVHLGLEYIEPWQRNA